MLSRRLCVLLVFACSALVAAPIEYISPGATYRYTCATSAHCVSTTGFTVPGFDHSAWLVGAAPFSNVGGGDFAANTGWTAGFDPALRHSFFLGTPVDMTAQIGVDNGYDLWVNGVHVSGANAEGFTSRWEYSVFIPASYWVSGTNVIAIQLEDHGGLTAFDMRLTGDESGLIVPPTGHPVPEPASLILLGSGLVALARKRMA